MGFIQFIKNKKVLVGGAVGLSAAICYDPNDDVFAQLTTPKGLENTVLVQETEGSATRLVSEKKDGKTSVALAETSITKATTPRTTASTTKTATTTKKATEGTLVSSKKSSSSATDTDKAPEVKEGLDFTELELKFIEAFKQLQTVHNSPTIKAKWKELFLLIPIVENQNNFFFTNTYNNFIKAFNPKSEDVYMTKAKDYVSRMERLIERGDITERRKALYTIGSALLMADQMLMNLKMRHDGQVNAEHEKAYAELLTSVHQHMENYIKELTESSNE